MCPPVVHLYHHLLCFQWIQRENPQMNDQSDLFTERKKKEYTYKFYMIDYMYVPE